MKLSTTSCLLIIRDNSQEQKIPDDCITQDLLKQTSNNRVSTFTLHGEIC